MKGKVRPIFLAAMFRFFFAVALEDIHKDTLEGRPVAERGCAPLPYRLDPTLPRCPRPAIVGPEADQKEIRLGLIVHLPPREL
jgi:hypothetical protein